MNVRSLWLVVGMFLFAGSAVAAPEISEVIDLAQVVDKTTIECGTELTVTVSFAPTEAEGTGDTAGEATDDAIDDALGYWINLTNECEGCPDGGRGCDLSFSYRGGTVQTRLDHTTADDGTVTATGSVAAQAIEVTISCSACEDDEC